jgi:hypothetical protein
MLLTETLGPAWSAQPVVAWTEMKSETDELIVVLR